VVEQLVRQWGVVVELKHGVLKVWNATLGDDGEFLGVPEDVYDLLADHRDTVKYYLEEEARRVAKFTEVWWHHNTDGYRDECHRYWAMQRNDD